MNRADPAAGTLTRLVFTGHHLGGSGLSAIGLQGRLRDQVALIVSSE